ncbi:MAG: aminodeoxychorismate synthase component I [Bacteroidetes bacterium]|nr:aminodeoxychorismate synthase component I [Bacteroidota bacterium]
MKNQKLSAIQKMNEYGKNKIPFLFIIDFEMQEPQIIKLEEVNPAEILFDINGTRNFSTGLNPKKEIRFEKYPVPFEMFRLSFDKILKEIHAGNTYLLNLTFPTKIETNLTLKETFFLSKARYKLFYKNKFIVFSPEPFVSITNCTISSYPMKGTIDAAVANAKELILMDKKETAEHNTIVDLIRNDLNIVAKNVRVEKFRYVEEVITTDKTLLQVSSKITGDLDAGFNTRIGSLMFSLLPAGSISGAPKKKTIEIIKNTETYSRGFYTGIFGYFDGAILDSAVMIRFIENTGKEMIYKSGGGITFMSDAESEYQELIDKVYVPIA